MYSMVQNHSQILRLSTCRVSIVQGRRRFSTGRCGRSPQVRAQVRSSWQVTGLSRWGKPKPSKILHIYIYIFRGYIYWLVVSTPLKNMKVKWGGLSHILWKIKNVPNHQPVYHVGNPKINTDLLIQGW